MDEHLQGAHPAEAAELGGGGYPHPLLPPLRLHGVDGPSTANPQALMEKAPPRTLNPPGTRDKEVKLVKPIVTTGVAELYGLYGCVQKAQHNLHVAAAQVVQQHRC